MENHSVRPTRWYSNRQEKEVAKQVNGKQVCNSGATSFNKGDVISESWLIECKTCMSEKKSFAIKHDWLTKNREEAFAMNKPFNALVFDFGPGSERYYIIDEKTYLRIKEMLDE